MPRNSLTTAVLGPACWIRSRSRITCVPCSEPLNTRSPATARQHTRSLCPTITFSGDVTDVDGDLDTYLITMTYDGSPDGVLSGETELGTSTGTANSASTTS